MSAEIDEYPSLRFKILEKKTTKCHGWTNGQCENSIPHHKQSLRGGGGGGGIIKQFLWQLFLDEKHHHVMKGGAD